MLKVPGHNKKKTVTAATKKNKKMPQKWGKLKKS